MFWSFLVALPLPVCTGGGRDFQGSSSEDVVTSRERSDVAFQVGSLDADGRLGVRPGGAASARFVTA